MYTQITSRKEYDKVMAIIESILSKATAAGGFSELSTDEVIKLTELSRLSEVYEDHILRLCRYSQNAKKEKPPGAVCIQAVYYLLFCRLLPQRLKLRSIFPLRPAVRKGQLLADLE